MSKLRLAFALVVGLCAVSLVGVASASAAVMEFLNGGVTVTGQEALKAKTDTGDYVLLAEPLGIKTEILCEKAETKGGWVGETNLAKGELSFNTCVVNKPAGCKVKQPIAFNVIGELIEPLPWILFKPETGTTFVELVLEGCLVAGTYKVVGEQECEIVNGTVAAVSHQIKCAEGATSKLTVGGLPAGFEGEFNAETANALNIG